MHDVIIGAYTDALTPVFLHMVPLMLLAVVLLFFVQEQPLATAIERDILPGSLEIDGARNCSAGSPLERRRRRPHAVNGPAQTLGPAVR